MGRFSYAINRPGTLNAPGVFVHGLVDLSHHLQLPSLHAEHVFLIARLALDEDILQGFVSASQRECPAAAHAARDLRRGKLYDGAERESCATRRFGLLPGFRRRR
jgi:hypothetical protein